MLRKAKRIEKGCYNYRGYLLNCIGYWQPDHRVCWEAWKLDEDGDKEEVIAKGFRKGEIMREIDSFLDKPIAINRSI